MTLGSKAEGRFICPAGETPLLEQRLPVLHYHAQLQQGALDQFLRSTFEVCDTICQARLIPLGLVRPRGLRIEN
jgi:hypothetical protein